MAARRARRRARVFVDALIDEYGPVRPEAEVRLVESEELWAVINREVLRELQVEERTFTPGVAGSNPAGGVHSASCEGLRNPLLERDAPAKHREAVSR